MSAEVMQTPGVEPLDSELRKYPVAILRAIQAGLLNPEFHERLLGDRAYITQVAGVPESALTMRLSEYVTQGQFDWVKAMRSNATAGLVILGKQEVPVLDFMVAVTGVCLRNYTDARLMVLQTLLADLKDGGLVSPTLLLVPNFCQSDKNAGAVAEWQVPSLLGLLLSRAVTKKKTILYATSMNLVRTQYGSAIADHLEAKFALSTNGEVKYPET